MLGVGRLRQLGGNAACGHNRVCCLHVWPTGGAVQQSSPAMLHQLHSKQTHLEHLPVVHHRHRPAAAPQVRVGNPAKVRPELRSACLDAQVERTAQGIQAARLREQADQLTAQVREWRRVQAGWLEQVRAHKAAGNQLAPAQEQRLQQADRQIRDTQRQADSLWRAADDQVKAAAIEVLRSAAVSGSLAAQFLCGVLAS